jgi:hypothetical protein
LFCADKNVGGVALGRLVKGQKLKVKGGGSRLRRKLNRTLFEHLKIEG